MPILVFLGLSVLELGPMYATDRQTDVRHQTDVKQKHRLMPPPYGGGGIIIGLTRPIKGISVVMDTGQELDQDVSMTGAYLLKCQPTDVTPYVECVAYRFTYLQLAQVRRKIYNSLNRQKQSNIHAAYTYVRNL